ncbi:hypothetical protein HDF12_001997 [Edaphobacter lichenicola]|uniref:Uncharacterized protein n=1 Tax=Tunturiibacter lichenicola TaxID=2051959 RepID=A0A7Y9NM09_9BACT|nr:hypothetical protein [Edaphobacter lichenicola]
MDLPFQCGGDEVFTRSSTLQDLVPEWQGNVPIRALEDAGWRQPGTFYVHVGTEDSLGSSLPPGASALVVPIDEVERMRPNPRAIYLLQFGNGYRCSRCVVTRGKLLLLVSGRRYNGPQEFAYPKDVGSQDEYGCSRWAFRCRTIRCCVHFQRLSIVHRWSCPGSIRLWIGCLRPSIAGFGDRGRTSHAFRRQWSRSSTRSSVGGRSGAIGGHVVGAPCRCTDPTLCDTSDALHRCAPYATAYGV